MSYGISPYGLGSYGGIAADLIISRAYPISPKTIRVILSKEPQHIGSSIDGDVFNTRTWKITRLDNNFVFNILKISIADFPITWDIRLLESLGNKNIQHRIESNTLLDVGGSLIDDPRYFVFNGVLQKTKSTIAELTANRRYSSRDLQNLPAPYGEIAGGVFNINSSGDYSLHDGDNLVRKLIYRRLMTVPGSFYYLPNYGVGLRVKEPLPNGDLESLRTKIKNEIMKEPEVDATHVQLIQNANSLVVLIRARLKSSGESFSMSIKSQFNIQL